MKKIDANMIIKNLTGIFCGAIVLSLLLPFMSFKSNVNTLGVTTSSAESSISGFNLMKESGLFGIMLIVIPILILLVNYLPQLNNSKVAKYKKIITLVLSLISILCLFISPNQLSAGSNISLYSLEIKSSYRIGFWLILIFEIALVALSVIQFFKLKGNKVFDAVNNASKDNFESVDISQINLDKITEVAKNTKNTIETHLSSIKENVINEPSNEDSNNENINLKNNDNDAKPYKKQVKASVKVSNSEELLNLITKLYNMKESGILTDEEFSEKKKELLDMM